MKYVLLLTIWNEAHTINEVYVLDYGLTGEDCIGRLEDTYSPNMMGVLACEVDQGAPQPE